MKPNSATYLLQVAWVNDHTNPEYATLTVEGREGERYETGFEVLVDPNAPAIDKECKLRELREVAFALRRHHGGWHSLEELPADLVRLYRVVEEESRTVPARFTPVPLLESLYLKLEVVCEFDKDGYPVVPAQTEPAPDSAASERLLVNTGRPGAPLRLSSPAPLDGDSSAFGENDIP